MRKYVSIIAAMLLLAPGCSADKIEPELQPECVTTASGASVNVSALQQGQMRIYVSEEMAARLEESVDSFLAENAWMGVTSVRRTFPKDEEFEERTRGCGLHRWYDIEFSAQVPLTKAGNGLSAASGIDKIEYRPKVKHLTGDEIGWRHGTIEAYSQLKQQRSGDLPFDDPGLESQWNFINQLHEVDAQSGCDINVVPAWENYLCGHPEVIVAVVDGGIDFRHEDLADNMWHNPSQSGDRIYGYNFMDYSYHITAEDHGTHVAGILAAVNNNGTGCCGIAGGDKKRGIPGIKLMSCQIFKQGSEKAGDDINAIKWAADHGAVICQNSWAYEVEYLPDYTKEVIDYFNNYAGTDMHGNQTGPMMGGLAVFAAGNEMTKTPVYPAAYSGVLAVSALGADYKLASYSNYGDWVDIAAPGGDEIDIFSTMIDNNYGWYGGTSMAAPHVSGVAALIIANCGGEGFTRDNLLEILLNYTTDISSYNPHKYPGKGMVNAFEALSANTGAAQFTITGFDARAEGRTIKGTVSVKAAGDSEPWVSGAIVYYSKTPFTSTEGISSFKSEIKSGVGLSPFAIESGLLEYGQQYYVAVALYDEFGNRTALSDVVTIKTTGNVPPVISGPEGPITVQAHETIRLSYNVADPYGDAITVALESDNGNVVKMSRDGDTVEVEIKGGASRPGKYSFKLTVTDEYSLSASQQVHYTVLGNHSPELIAPVGDIIIEDKSSCIISLGDHFRDEDNEELNYTVKIDDPLVVKNTIDADSNLKLIPQQNGYANISITATDGIGEQAGCTFRLLIRDGSHAVEIYPNPVTAGKLYLRTGKAGSVEVTIANAAGGVVFDGAVEATPFEPATVDISVCAAGVYNVTTSAFGETETRKVVKL